MLIEEDDRKFANTERLPAKGFRGERRAAFRNLIDSIAAHPTGCAQPYEFTPYGRLGALMGATCSRATPLRPPINRRRGRSARRFEQLTRRAGDPLMHVHHQGRAEQRRRQVDDGDRHERGDEEARREHGPLLGLAQALGVGNRTEAHGRQLEIDAAEQVRGGNEKDDHADTGEQQERQRHQIDHDGQRRRLDAFDQRAPDRHVGAGQVGRIVLALDQLGDLVGVETGDQRGDRRHQEYRAGDKPEAGQDGEHPFERIERPMGVRPERGFEPAAAAGDRPGDQPMQPDAERDQQHQRKPDRRSTGSIGSTADYQRR
jgi:hypothetical protein